MVGRPYGIKQKRRRHLRRDEYKTYFIMQARFEEAQSF